MRMASAATRGAGRADVAAPAARTWRRGLTSLAGSIL